jgi:hypothetical protein
MKKYIVCQSHSVIAGIAIGLAIILLVYTPLTVYALPAEVLLLCGSYPTGVSETGIIAPFDEPTYPITPSISISINRESIDYGDIFPGDYSAEEIVEIDNTSSSDVHITMEVQGNDALAQSFYEQSLYLNDAIFEPEQVFCSIPAGGSHEITTQLRVLSSWSEPGVMEATFIFWAEAY